MVTAEQQVERRRDRLQELVEQCEDEELMDIVLPRLTKVLSLWELLLAKVEGSGPVRTRFPDIYREFESLQAQVRQTAQDYIISPQGGAMPLEVRNIEVARSLGILDEVNRMKVLPGASPSSSLTNKNVRYMENSKMLPPSKRFKMENSVPVHQNGIETPRTGASPVTSMTPATSAISVTPVTSVTPATSVTSVPSVTPATSVTSVTSVTPTTSVSSVPCVTPVPSVTPATPVTSALKPCLVSVSPLMIPAGSKLRTTGAADSSSPGSAPTPSPPPATPMEVTPGEDQGVEPLPAGQEQVLSPSDITAQVKELEKVLGSGPETGTDSQTQSGSVQPAAPCQDSSESAGACESKELQEGQEIYIQTEGLTVQLAEPGLDQIVIVNGPGGTTMHIQTPEGVPLEAVQALLGIEASDGAKAPQ